MQKEVTLGGLQDPRTDALEKLVESYRKKLELVENDAQSLGKRDFPITKLIYLQDT